MSALAWIVTVDGLPETICADLPDAQHARRALRTTRPSARIAVYCVAGQDGALLAWAGRGHEETPS